MVTVVLYGPVRDAVGAVLGWLFERYPVLGELFEEGPNAGQVVELDGMPAEYYELRG